jgi:hypothetical protein
MTEARCRKRRPRGPSCTLEEFQNTYGLPEDEAQRLYFRFGPGLVDLAVLMAAKGTVPRPSAREAEGRSSPIPSA